MDRKLENKESYSVLYLPRSQYIKDNKSLLSKSPLSDLTVGEEIDNFTFTSSIEDILSETTLKFLKSLQIDLMVGLDYLFRKFSILNKLFTDLIREYSIRSEIFRDENPLVTDLNDEHEKAIMEASFNGIKRELKHWRTDVKDFKLFINNQIEQFQKVHTGNLHTWFEKFAFDLAGSFKLDINLDRNIINWTSVLLFDVKKRYLGGINLIVTQKDVNFERVKIIGIKTSLYNLVERQSGKGVRDIAGKILEAVKLKAIEKELKEIFVISPTGTMPIILEKLGFKIEERYERMMMSFNPSGDYTKLIYQGDSVIKFSDARLTDVTNEL